MELCSRSRSLAFITSSSYKSHQNYLQKSIDLSKMDRLPIDITSTILAKLPIKSLFRCRSVCKTWCSIIDKPNFPNIHTPSFEPHEALILIPHTYQGEMFILQKYDDPLSPNPSSRPCKCSKIDLCFEENESLECLVGSCNGLFCFSSWENHFQFEGYGSMCVCNPATRECAYLPEVNFPDFYLKGIASGFGFDSSKKKFKAVNVFFYNEDEDEDAIAEIVSEVQVLTMGENSWRTVSNARASSGFVDLGTESSFVNGCCYWLTYRVSGFGSPIGLMGFDVETERIEGITNPEFSFVVNPALPFGPGYVKLGVLEGRLCVSDCCSFNDCHEIWIMKEKNVWVKQFVIQGNMIDGLSIKVVFPICFGRNGELILACEYKLLVSYNFETGKAVPLENGELPALGPDDFNDEEKPFEDKFQVFAYEGSLILPYVGGQFKMDHLPIEITTSILLKLSVKYVLRCRSVCKTWCSIIDSPNFPVLYTHSSTSEIDNPPSALILIPYIYEGQMLILQNYDDPSSEIRKCSHINLSFSYFEYLVGSCDGLFCFSSWEGHWEFECYGSMCVCNPATRECVELPEVAFPDFILHDIASGFGLSPSTKEFKVVNVFFFYENEAEDAEMRSEVQVLTLGSSSWRTVGIAPHGFTNLGPQAFVNGMVYWLTFRTSGPGSPIGLISFHMESERIEVIPNPNFSFLTNPECSYGPGYLKIGVLDDCLCISDCCSFDHLNEIWVMKEKNVWMKQFVIRKDALDERKLRLVIPICFGKNGELILLCEFKLLVSYNLETGRAVPIEDDDLPVYDFNAEDEPFEYKYLAFPYAGSLISPLINEQSREQYQIT